MCVLFVCVSVPHAYVCPQKLEEGMGCLRTADINWELPCGCWELNIGPLEEQLVLLAAEYLFIPKSGLHILSDIVSIRVIRFSCMLFCNSFTSGVY